MPTVKPRVTFTLTDEQYAALQEYRYGGRFKNQTQAILSLIDKGLELVDTQKAKKAPSTQDDALLSLFYKLNDEGKEKTLDYLDDLVSSGKYIQFNQNPVGKEA